MALTPLFRRVCLGLSEVQFGLKLDAILAQEHRLEPLHTSAHATKRCVPQQTILEQEQHYFVV